MSNDRGRGRGRGRGGNGNGDRGGRGRGRGNGNGAPQSAAAAPAPDQPAWGGRRAGEDTSQLEGRVRNIDLGNAAFPAMPAASSSSSGTAATERTGSERGPSTSQAGRGGPTVSGRGNGNGRGGGRGSGDDRGRGRGAGAGAVQGRRGVRRERPTLIEKMDVVVSKPNLYPDKASGKKGSSGRSIQLLSNFFVLKKKTDWCIFNYRVDFKPDEERTPIKKKLFKQHQATIGPNIFDGSTVWTQSRLHPDPLILYSKREEDNKKVEITVKLVKQLEPGDVAYLQFFNIIVRTCLSGLKLEEIGRHYYDRGAAIPMAGMGLTLWPGYITSMRNYEHQVMLCVEITHKVLRDETVLDVIAKLRQARKNNDDIKRELVGTIVMTHYNNRTYRIDDINFNATPKTTFPLGKEKTKTSFLEYYRDKYQMQIKDTNQPMLISLPKKKDYHRGMTEPLSLIPELCRMTGLSDDMRSNFTTMKALDIHLKKEPAARVTAINQFRTRLETCKEVQTELKKWGLEFNRAIEPVTGRVLPGEKITFGGGATEGPSDDADWTNAYRSKKLYQVNKPCDSWILILTQRDAGGIDQFLKTMQQVTTTLGFRIAQPLEIIRLANTQIGLYTRAIDDAMAKYGSRLNLAFIVLPSNKLDTYAAVKRKCVVDYGLSSQCFVARNLAPGKKLISVTTKVVVQMAAKLGNEPWLIKNPLQRTMVVGFDVYHCGKRKGQSVGAMVSTLTGALSRYYSTVSFHANKEELSSNMCTGITKCINAYAKENNEYPARIIMYRDGVGEGQLTFVYNTELAQIKDALKSIYGGLQQQPPRFSLIVCTKRINTRIFTAGPHIKNPGPGTVVDDVITLPERWDFFLIAQQSRIGTVSPTSYNVLYDEQGLAPDKIQLLTYKLCHMYYNWSGTVAVPAPCQYAHKLAYLTGLALGAFPSEALSHLLYYL